MLETKTNTLSSTEIENYACDLAIIIRYGEVMYHVVLYDASIN